MPETTELPREPASFVGRETHLARLGEALSVFRLITVTGPGGVGKTRLARRAAADAAARFPDGTRLIELSALRDPELLASTVSAELGLNEHNSRGQLEQILHYLRERRLLLILDTCEHLIDACAMFAEAVVAGTEHVTILATSRQPLFAPGEYDCQLSPLGACEEAVLLFAQRAAAVAPGFTVTDANRTVITRICTYLDGIPLALELAASRLRDLSLGELVKRLDHFLGLIGRQDSSVGVYRTLRDAIGWSYALCTPEEQALWERLSVFAGPVGADAAQQVCSWQGLDRETTGAAMFGLADKAMLTRGRVSRYSMLDPVREYGAERLAASGIAPQIRALHLHRYLAMATDLAANPLENQVLACTALRAEHADIRAALEYAATVGTEPGAVHPALRLPTDLEWYWMISARFQEARYWLTRGLGRIPERSPGRADALLTRGFLAANQGNAQPALADAEEGLEIAEETGDRRLIARALAYRAYALVPAGRIEEATMMAEEAETLVDTLGSSQLLLDLAKVYIYLLAGDLEGGLRQCERTLRSIPSGSGERWMSGYAHSFRGLSLSMLGRPDEGNQAALRGVAMKHEIMDTAGMASCLGVAALTSAAQRRPERTAWMLGATDKLCERFGTPFGGVDIMKAFKRQAAEEARTALGGDRFDEMIRDVRSRPIDDVIDMAVRDLDTMPALTAARR